MFGRHVAGDAELVNDFPHTLMSEAPLEDGNALPDERLKVLFAYCHPTLVLETRVALTLGMLGGLTNDQIAGALRVPPAIVAARLAGARAKIKKARIPFGVPRDGSLPERLAAVLATVYLIFNGAYAGDGQLAAEAIRLGRMLAELLPDESEVHGLLALMLLNDGRRTSRYRHGELVLLDDEERNPWDRERVAEGEQQLARARALYGRGAYVLRAEIASVHMAEPVDWPELVALYTELARLVPSGAVELNRAIAVAEVAGPEAALVIVERIEFEPSELDHYCSLHSTRADLLRRLGRTIDARYAYGRALQLTRSEPERRFLKRRIAELPPPAAADCEAFWDNALDRIKAAAEADEIEDAEAPAEDARAQRRRLPADAPDPAAHLEHVQPQLAKRERPPHGADH